MREGIYDMGYGLGAMMAAQGMAAKLIGLARDSEHLGVLAGECLKKTLKDYHDQGTNEFCRMVAWRVGFFDGFLDEAERR